MEKLFNAIHNGLKNAKVSREFKIGKLPSGQPFIVVAAAWVDGSWDDEKPLHLFLMQKEYSLEPLSSCLDKDYINECYKAFKKVTGKSGEVGVKFDFHIQLDESEADELGVKYLELLVELTRLTENYADRVKQAEQKAKELAAEKQARVDAVWAKFESRILNK